MLTRFVITVVFIGSIISLVWLFWGEIDLLLNQYNVQLGGVGSVVTIAVTVLSLFFWVFSAKGKQEKSQASLFVAKRDVVIGNKEEHNYYK